METFPAYFPLAGRRVVIAGDGDGAEAKVRLFRGSPAEVVRLRPDQALEPAAYQGADLIFVASYDADFAASAAAAVRAGGGGAPLNVVDRPELSDFHTPAIIDRGQVVAAVGTAGAAPLMAALLRAEIEARVPPGAGAIAALLGARRETLRAAFPDLPARRAFLRAALTGPIVQAAEAGDMDLAGRRLDAAIVAGWSAVGVVSLIDVPTATDLISLRALRALNTADIVVSAAGAAPIVDAHARRDAEHWSLQEASEDRLSDAARAGRLVAVVGVPFPADLAARLATKGVAAAILPSAPEA